MRASVALVLLACFWPSIVDGDSPQASAEPPPNVIIIFMDDMGYGDINSFGASGYRTSRLNRLADEGMVLRDFVVSSAVCSASRSALMTGCFNRRVSVSGAYGPKSDAGLNPDETTIAELCKSVGYSTACFGKWHLGHNPKFLPTNQGFDEYYGIPYSNDMWPLHPASVAKRQVDPDAEIPWAALPMIKATPGDVQIAIDDMTPEDQQEMTAEFTRRGVDFIQRHADEPFFLYMPHPMVHVPLYVNKKFRGKSNAGIFGDVMMEIDDSVGQIVDAVESIDASQRTLIVFTSDNGPWLAYGNHSGSSGGLREGKGTMFEGGYREPAIMRWKGTIPPGSETQTLCSTIDLLPTIASVIGAELPERKIDGLDITPLLKGEDLPAELTDRVFPGYYGGGQLQIIRDDRFKLVFDHRYRTLDGHPGGTQGRPVKYKMKSSGLALYDLDNDVNETTDVSAEHPEVVARLESAAQQYRESLGDKLQKMTGAEVRPAGMMMPGDEVLPLVWR